MKKQIALNCMLALMVLVIIFHLFIITRVVPYEIVWAGKLRSAEEMVVFESVSLAVNILLFVLLLIKRKQLKSNRKSKVLAVFLWIFFVIFCLNTIGNLFAETLFEKIVFTPLTLISAVLIFVIVKKDSSAPGEIA